MRKHRMRASRSQQRALVAVVAALAFCVGSAPLARAQGETGTPPEAAPPPPPQPAPATGPIEVSRVPSGAPAPGTPYGANLFTGNFAAQRSEGVNPNYEILPGDRIMVNAWGSVNINGVFAVDSQGNVFFPQVGPVHVGGVRNASLSSVVKAAIGRVYRNFDVYTNLLTASPVAVYVTGGVRRPGRYAGIPSDSVLFFLDQAGGIDPELGSYRHVTVMRGAQAVAEIDLYDFLIRGVMQSPQFADGDAIVVGRRGPVVSLTGAVPIPALVEMREERFTGADVLAVIPERPRANEVTIEGSRHGRPWLRSVALDDFRTTVLTAGDAVSIREDFRPQSIVVRLEGEFQGPSVLTVRRGARLLDVLNYVPIDPELANIEGVHIKRSTVAAQQRTAILDSLNRLERSALLALSHTANESQIRVREAELVQQFVQHARTVQPLGRVVTSLRGEQMNLVLEADDVIVIPTRTNVVRVEGEVQITQAMMYAPGLTVRDYIRRAGGYTNRSDRGRALIVRPNADVLVADTSDEVQPGDAILVLPRIAPKGFQFALDLSQIIYQIAVATSVVLRI